MLREIPFKGTSATAELKGHPLDRPPSLYNEAFVVTQDGHIKTVVYKFIDQVTSSQGTWQVWSRSINLQLYVTVLVCIISV